jgi:hypothetical protein
MPAVVMPSAVSHAAAKMLEAITALFVRQRSVLKIAEDIFAVFAAPEAGEGTGRNPFSSNVRASIAGALIARASLFGVSIESRRSDGSEVDPDPVVPCSSAACAIKGEVEATNRTRNIVAKNRKLEETETEDFCEYALSSKKRNAMAKVSSPESLSKHALYARAEHDARSSARMAEQQLVTSSGTVSIWQDNSRSS